MSYRKEYGMESYDIYHDGIITVRKKMIMKNTWEGNKLLLTDISLLAETLPLDSHGKYGKPL